MEPIQFLRIAFDVEKVKRQEDGTYLLYDLVEGEPNYQSRRMPELECKLGPKDIVFESTSLLHDHVMYDVYSISPAGDEISLQCMLQVAYNRMTIYGFQKEGDIEWSNVNARQFERERQLVLDYLYEHPRFRLAFVTGAMEVEDF